MRSFTAPTVVELSRRFVLWISWACLLDGCIPRFIATSVLTCSQIIGKFNEDADCAQAASALPTGVFSAAAVFGNVEAACSLAFAKWNPDNWPAERTVPEAEEEEDDGDLIIPDV